MARFEWWAGRNTVRFVLRSRRNIKTSGGNQPDIKQVIRSQFHTQLKNLWAWTPTLHAIKAAGLPVGDVKSKGISISGLGPADRFYCGTIRSRPNTKLIPLVTFRCGWECRLDVRFLIRQDRINTADPNVGDLDRRLVILLDALRIPHDDTQIKDEWGTIPDEYYCLLEDDSLIDRVTSETMPLLNDPVDPSIEPDMDQVTHVTVTLMPRLDEFVTRRS